MARPLPVLFFLLTILLFPSTVLAAEADEADIEPGTVIVSQFPAAEQQYIDLAEQFHTRLEAYWKKSNEFYQGRGDKITREESDKFEADHDPSPEFLPKLLVFERKYAGQDVGLDALSDVVSYAGRGGDKNSAAYRARREVLARLPDYADHELVTMALSGLRKGTYDPQVIDTLRALAQSANASQTVRAVAQLVLAEKLLSLRAARENATERLASAEAGMPTRNVDELDFYREHLASLPPADKLAAGADEAVAMLESLAGSDDSLRQPVYRSIDPANHLIRIDSDKTKTATPLAIKAAALLFKDRHLRVGQTAPDIDLALIDGKPWSLADQRGRVVVIQFSFTGCGPCEAMYPGLRKLQEEFGDRVSILTIMRDPTPETALAKTAEGKFTWPVACDGPDFKMTTQWAIDSFPEVYVINLTGQITAIGSRDEQQLHWRVAQLLVGKK